MTAKRKPGRPRRRQPRPGERVSLGLRVTPSIKAALDRAAQISGRSQSQEAEFRIERSFQDQKLLDDALRLAYGHELAGILLTMGEAMMATGRHAGFMATLTGEGPDTWWDNPYAFDQALQAANDVLQSVKPAGDSAAPRLGQTDRVDLDRVAEGLGRGIAAGVLQEIVSEEPTTSRAITRAPRLREALGAHLVDRMKGKLRVRS